MSPRPNVTRPNTSAASTTPRILPLPPQTDTPPRITMLMISSSQPCAIEGRVEPSRDVSSTAAKSAEQAREREQREAIAIHRECPQSGSPPDSRRWRRWRGPSACDAGTAPNRHGEQREQRQLDGNGSDKISLPESRERLRVVLEHPIAEHRIGGAAEQRHGADGGDDGRHAPERHQRAVDAPGQQGRCQARSPAMPAVPDALRRPPAPWPPTRAQ